MLYESYQALTDFAAPARLAARALASWSGQAGRGPDWAAARELIAWLQVAADAEITHVRPPFDIDRVVSGGAELAVREETALSLPFCRLARFAKDGAAAPQPRMLVVAPLSGHFSTLLRGAVRTLLQDHDVYITDWINARDVPRSEGPFGFEDHVDYLIAFLEHLGPETHMLAVCQPCVQALIAAAVMAERRSPCQPRSLTLMGGPIDPREAPTAVNALAQERGLGWFERQLIHAAPWGRVGAGRRVYPGFLQLIAFMAMNPERHLGQWRRLRRLLAEGRADEARAIQDFYREYFAVLDLTAEFYLETIDKVFQRALLPAGRLEHRGRPVRTDAICRTALLTVEGERDDICAVGQTAAAHDLCASLRPHLRRHHLQPGVGHYGLFSGRKWENQIYPQVRNLVLAVS